MHNCTAGNSVLVASKTLHFPFFALPAQPSLCPAASGGLTPPPCRRHAKVAAALPYPSIYERSRTSWVYKEQLKQDSHLANMFPVVRARWESACVLEIESNQRCFRSSSLGELVTLCASHPCSVQSDSQKARSEQTRKQRIWTNVYVLGALICVRLLVGFACSRSATYPDAGRPLSSSEKQKPRRMFCVVPRAWGQLSAFPMGRKSKATCCSLACVF